MARTNRQVLLVRRPGGIPQREHFRIAEGRVPTWKAGETLVRNEWLSVEPAMRGWVNAVGSASEPVAIGEVMRSIAAGRIVESSAPDWPVGTPVTDLFGWQAHAVARPDAIAGLYRGENLGKRLIRLHHQPA